MQNFSVNSPLGCFDKAKDSLFMHDMGTGVGSEVTSLKSKRRRRI